MRSRQCADGYFHLAQSDVDSLGDLSVQRVDGVSQHTCRVCPDSTRCAAGSNVESLILREGFWRLSNRTLDIYPCSGCLGNETAGRCHLGQEGPMCMVVRGWHSNPTAVIGSDTPDARSNPRATVLRRGLLHLLRWWAVPRLQGYCVTHVGRVRASPCRSSRDRCFLFSAA